MKHKIKEKRYATEGEVWYQKRSGCFLKKTGKHLKILRTSTIWLLLRVITAPTAVNGQQWTVRVFSSSDVFAVRFKSITFSNGEGSALVFYNQTLTQAIESWKIWIVFKIGILIRIFSSYIKTNWEVLVRTHKGHCNKMHFSVTVPDCTATVWKGKAPSTQWQHKTTNAKFRKK